jgi:hypothetical protein
MPRQFLSFIATKSIELSICREAASWTVTQQLPNILWLPKVCYRGLKIPPLVPILSQINPVHKTRRISFFKVHFNIIHVRKSISF